MKLKHLYLALSVLEICYTWYYNIQWFQTAENPTFLIAIAFTFPLFLYMRANALENLKT